MRKVSVMPVFLSVALLLGGCGAEQKEEVSQAEKKIKIGMIFDTFVVERWQRDRDVFVATAQDLGAEVDTQNANGSVEKQEQLMRYFIDEQMDAIVIVPIESEALCDEIREARDHGIKVISYDRLVLNAGTDLYVSFDNEGVGALMGEAFTDTLKPGDKIVMICGSQTDANVASVEKGFRNVVTAYGLDIADVCYAADWEAEEAGKYVDEHTELLENVRGIMCGNDNLAGSAIQALVENRMDTPVVVGQDADLDACQRIVEGSQYMTVFKPVEKLAQRAAEATIELVTGGKIEGDATVNDGEFDVPFIMLNPLAVTKKNINATIIDSGFHMKEEVYLNRPEEMP